MRKVSIKHLTMEEKHTEGTETANKGDKPILINQPSEKDKSSKTLQGCIQVSSRQRGNPILKSIRSVPWEFVDGLVPDYTMGSKACAFYLSVRYHTLNPNYIHERLKQVRI